jgi:hypothetical protein
MIHAWRSLLFGLCGIAGVALVLATPFFIYPGIRIIELPDSTFIVTKAEMARLAAAPSVAAAEKATTVQPPDTRADELAGADTQTGTELPAAQAASTLPEASIDAVPVYRLPAGISGDIAKGAAGRPPRLTAKKSWAARAHVTQSRRGTWLSAPNPSTGARS